MSNNDIELDGAKQSVCPECGSGMWATWVDMEGETDEDKVCLQCGHREQYRGSK